MCNMATAILQMDCCCRSEDERIQAKINREIDAELRRNKKARRKEIKLLLQWRIWKIYVHQTNANYPWRWLQRNGLCRNAASSLPKHRYINAEYGSSFKNVRI